MPKYTYKPIKNVVEETYTEHTGKSIYEALGEIDLSTVTLVVTANTEEESFAVRQGVTDVRMWQLDSTEE